MIPEEVNLEDTEYVFRVGPLLDKGEVKKYFVVTDKSALHEGLTQNFELN